MSTSLHALAQSPKLTLRNAGARSWREAAASAHVLDELGAESTTIGAERNEEIFGQGESSQYCYLVVRGCVRTVTFMEDGRRQIAEFLVRGDFFGWEAVREYDFAAEAVTPVTLRRYSRDRLEALADRDPTLARRLRELTARQFRAARERIVLLGRKTASEKIASFLLDLADRINADNRTRLELPMSRTDIADYLGLTIETVCRSLTQFRRDGIIVVEGSFIDIRDKRTLGAVSSLTLH